MKIRWIFSLLLASTALLACSQGAAPKAPQARNEPPPPLLVGHDRDAHGCIGSAGYRWCNSTQRCERPWELAQSRAFDNTPQAYEAFCK
jgi:hypothetical protein